MRATSATKRVTSIERAGNTRRPTSRDGRRAIRLARSRSGVPTPLPTLTTRPPRLTSAARRSAATTSPNCNEIEHLLATVELQILAPARAVEPDRDHAIAVARTVDVGQAQHAHVEPVRVLEGTAVHFPGHFARAVGVLGVHGAIFGDREPLDLTVDLARRGEDDLFDAGVARRAEHVVRPDDVARERVVCIGHGAEHVALRGEVIDALGAAHGEGHALAVADVALDEARLVGQRGADAATHVVERHDLVARGERRDHQMGANKAGATCHEYFHAVAPAAVAKRGAPLPCSARMRMSEAIISSRIDEFSARASCVSASPKGTPMS